MNSHDGTLSQNSNTKVPTQNAVKTYVDGQIAGLNADKIIEEIQVLRQWTLVQMVIYNLK